MSIVVFITIYLFSLREESCVNHNCMLKMRKG